MNENQLMALASVFIVSFAVFIVSFAVGVWLRRQNGKIQLAQAQLDRWRELIGLAINSPASLATMEEFRLAVDDLGRCLPAWGGVSIELRVDVGDETWLFSPDQEPKRVIRKGTMA